MLIRTRTDLRRSQPIANPRERGSVVLAALSIIIFVSMAALVVDFGMLLVSRTELSKAVDAAALAGAQELPDKPSARTFAKRYVGLNVSPARDAGPVSTVTFPASNIIRVRATMNPPAFFSKVMGFTDFTVGAFAEATRFDPDVALI